ncbi:tetratricopeptide repeat protein [Algoriphagus ratkowskyi]|nr:tetratricopeptide repeat protein [Algoriphagus ratkowskyi]
MFICLTQNSVTGFCQKPDVALFQWGQEEFEKGNFEASIKFYSEAIMFNPNEFFYYYSRGLSMVELKRNMEAIIDFTKSIDLNPSEGGLYAARGQCKGNLGDFFGAISDFTKAIEYYPKNSLFFYQRGIAKIKLGKTESGCIDLSKSGELGYSKAYLTINKACN